MKKGGILVYSTCTVFHEENEDGVESFLASIRNFDWSGWPNPARETFSSFIEEGYFKTFPPREGMDGFFVARMGRR